MARSGSSATATVVSGYSSRCGMFMSLVACCLLLLMPQLSSPAPTPQNQQGGREAVSTRNEPPGGQIQEIVTATNDTPTPQLSDNPTSALRFRLPVDSILESKNEEIQEAQGKNQGSTSASTSVPIVSSGSSSIISSNNNNKKTYSAALPQTLLASNSTPVSFITLNRNNRPSFLVYGSSLSSSSTIRPAYTYMINNDRFNSDLNANQSDADTTKVDAPLLLSIPSSIIISLQSNDSSSSSINPTRPGTDSFSLEQEKNDEFTGDEEEQNTTNQSLKFSSTPAIVVSSSSTTTTPVSIAFKNDQTATISQTSTSTTTTTTTTTVRPDPPSNVFNGLSKIGTATIGLGITSAAYAAAALWIPFIGRRKKRSSHSTSWYNNEINFHNAWFIDNNGD